MTTSWSPWNVTGGLQSEILSVLYNLQYMVNGLSDRHCYSFRINMGDVPMASGPIASSNIFCTNSIIQSATATSLTSTRHLITVNLRTDVFPNANYVVTLGYQSLRPPPFDDNVYTRDNDVASPVALHVETGSFKIYVEESNSVIQNIAIVGTIQRF